MAIKTIFLVGFVVVAFSLFANMSHASGCVIVTQQVGGQTVVIPIGCD